jgi:hypothetical protein
MTTGVRKVAIHIIVCAAAGTNHTTGAYTKSVTVTEFECFSVMFIDVNPGL